MHIDETTNDAQNINEVSEGEQSPSTTETPAPRTIAEATDRASSEMQALIDLSKAEKFLLNGKEYRARDIEEWQRGALRQADYTKKTQALVEREKTLLAELEAKYEPYKKYSGENLLADLVTIKNNPNLVDKFKEIYGEKFSPALELLGLTKQEQQEVMNEARSSGLDPQTMSQIQEVLNLGKTFKEKEAQAMQSELDARFSEFSKKFPDVDEDLVTQELMDIAENKGKLDREDFEKVYQKWNDRLDGIVKNRYSQLVNKQKTKNIAGQDTFSGGGVPGLAPKNPRTIKEASELAYQAMINQM